MPDPNSELDTSWTTNAAAWTAAVRGGGIASRRLATDAAISNAIARVAPRRVLDLGCGEGWLCRALRERGIEVLGVDASAPLIHAAREAQPGAYLHAHYTDLDRSLTGGGFDLCVANFALLGEDLPACLAAIARVLEPAGALLIQTLHPLSAGPPYLDGWRREDFAGFATPSREPWRSMPWYFRTLGSWLACLRDAGFELRGVEEPLHPSTLLPLSLLLEARCAATIGPLMSNVQTVLHRYRSHQDFEDARDELHALGAAAMRAVLDAALAPCSEDELGLLVMALSDVLYPPAMTSMREWLEHPDIDMIAMPAASALDRAAGGRFEIDRYWSGNRTDIAQTFAALAAWWDAGKVELPSEAEWLAARNRKREDQQEAVPPPSPAPTAAQEAAMRPALLALVQDFRALDPAAQHAIEHRAVTRVLAIWRRFAPADPRLTDAMNVVARYLRDAATEQELADARAEATACIQDARDVAAWNPVHEGWLRPDAKAAAEVAQAVAYLCSPDPSNRLQALHFSRHALAWSGAGVDAVTAEIAWQHDAVKGSR